jgi:hypothetical protein
MNHQKRFGALLLLIGLSALNAARAQFGPDGVGLMLPLCVTITWDNPTTQAYVKKSNEPDFWDELISRKKAEPQCQSMLPPKLVQSCEKLLAATNPDGTLNEELYNRTLSSANWDFREDVMNKYHDCAAR